MQLAFRRGHLRQTYSFEQWHIIQNSSLYFATAWIVIVRIGIMTDALFGKTVTNDAFFE